MNTNDAKDDLYVEIKKSNKISQTNLEFGW